MRIFFVFIFLFFSCAYTCLETRQFGLNENIPIDKKSIVKIDTVKNEQGGVIKLITYQSRCK